MKFGYRWNKWIRVAVFTLAAVGLAGAAVAGTSVGPGVQIKVKGSLDEALGQLRKMVADNGMMIMGELHQGKVLAMTGIKVQSETVFVGNPTVGKELFSAEPGAGLVAPVRVNLYVNAQGDTVLSYVPPSETLAAFGNPKADEIGKMLDQKLRGLTVMLAK